MTPSSSERVNVYLPSHARKVATWTLGVYADRASLTGHTPGPKWPHSPHISSNVASLLIGGAVAQLGERLVRNEEVRGSNPLGSTILGCVS